MQSLRLNRVFLSANPLNIEVFRKIASHDKFRHQGHELLSDEDKPDDDREWVAACRPQSREWINERHEEEERDLCPKWFKHASRDNYLYLERRELRDEDRPDLIARRELVFAQFSLEKSFKHYRRLLRQQKRVLAGRSDLEAFAFGVKQFPALKRVTITPAAHGGLNNPLYQTPMIRAFPDGFNYPVPRGWLYCRGGYEQTAKSYSWNQYPELKDRYRGFRTAMRVLANEPNSVFELVMTSNSIATGINCTIFDEPREEYDHFAAVLKKPGFRRLDMTLLVTDDLEEDYGACWRHLLNGRLRQALGEAKELEEFRLDATIDTALYRRGGYSAIPLQDLVPVEQWPKLRHFGISGFVISRDNCVSLLKTLPKSIRSIELSTLHFINDDENLYGLLEEIKRMVSEGTLWGDRDAGSRPKITIGVPIGPVSCDRGLGVWIEKEVEDFIYGEGANPIMDCGYRSRQCVDRPVGVVRDALEPGFEYPYAKWLQRRDDADSYRSDPDSYRSEYYDSNED
ncbi:uncharacterized protein N7515_008053 [Penicillium bovifimosum]|uniref:Uncharacterized protein n=1 Tax=Penicillium bovifimosum TaxID=126998 RepID=A0A9W9GMH9_9EURO|nr:uncharacterized protein N7515_008053 [Penicillium bovifimosum]KAJ5124228.1 hypothetical protein N7515_008053 [Penicillium bovifimosum]